MATITFSTFPAEIQLVIAKHCENSDLINLCLTSKWVHETCLRVLYRHVDLRLDHGLEHKLSEEFRQMLDARKKQQHFVHTLLSNPQYGEHVRCLKGVLCIASFDDCNINTLGEDMSSDEELWYAMQSLTNVQSVDIGSRNSVAYSMTVPTKQFPDNLFQSATSVRLVGQVQYGLAKSILNAINPATLKYLCLDMVQDRRPRSPKLDYMPGHRGEDGRIIALGATSGLLKTLTGHCTGLRTLILRRIGQTQDGHDWHAAAEEASYIEWASFIDSVRGTVKKFIFEQAGGTSSERLSNSIIPDETSRFRIMDERFRRLVFPTIVSGNWPCLTNMELRGVRGSNGQCGMAALAMELEAVLGHAKIVVEALESDTPRGVW